MVKGQVQRGTKPGLQAQAGKWPNPPQEWWKTLLCFHCSWEDISFQCPCRSPALGFDSSHLCPNPHWAAEVTAFTCGLTLCPLWAAVCHLGHDCAGWGFEGSWTVPGRPCTKKLLVQVWLCSTMLVFHAAPLADLSLCCLLWLCHYPFASLTFDQYLELYNHPKGVLLGPLLCLSPGWYRCQHCECFQRNRLIRMSSPHWLCP